ncbi:MAG: DHA2 family efflux MFS transporter permease subunit [Gammaproteobacteria bacterium]|nr:DHA2 family efflux MFS transporter permease subunit [Gammaproteobacteria bacterium]
MSTRDPISGRQWLLIILVQIVTLAFGMTITASNVVLPQMRGALSVTQDQIAMVVTSYLVAAAVGTPLTGWLAARLGWRRLMMGTVAGFTLSSALCGLAGSLEMLVLTRVAQGLFGAPLMPLGQGILLASFPRHMHPRVLMLWGVGGVMGPVLGPVFGGLIAESLSWRWAFFMIVPFGLVGLLLAWVALRDQVQGKAQRLDGFGFLTLAIAVGMAQLVLDRGQRLDWFESTEIVLESVTGLIAFYLFVTHSLTSRAPFLSPALFVDRNFVLGIVLAMLMGALAFTPVVLFPPLLQDLRDYPETVIGYLMSARGIGNFMSFFVVVQFTRYSARLCLATGLVLQAIAGWAMTQLNIDMSNLDVFWTNLLHGFGFGLSYTPMAALAFTTLSPTLIVEGSALFNLMRNLGSSLFISVCVLVLVRSTAQSYAGLGGVVSPFNELFHQADVAAYWSTSSSVGLASIAREIQRQASMVGYLNAFHLFTLAALSAIPLAYLFRAAPREAS